MSPGLFLVDVPLGLVIRPKLPTGLRSPSLLLPSASGTDALCEDAYPSREVDGPQTGSAADLLARPRLLRRGRRRPAHLAALGAHQVPHRHQKGRPLPLLSSGRRPIMVPNPARDATLPMSGVASGARGPYAGHTRRPAEVANPSWKPPSRSRRGSGPRSPGSPCALLP
jgi:hypothetical protein